MMNTRDREADALALLKACEEDCFQRIKDEGQIENTSSAGNDIALKQSTLQQIFRLCCKAYAIRELQVSLAHLY